MKPLSWAALAGVWVLWGSAYLAIRVSVETFPPFLALGLRFLVAGAMLWPLCRHFSSDRSWTLTRMDLIRIAVSAILLIVLGNGLLAVSETRISSGDAALLFGSLPFWILLFEAVRARRMVSGAVVVGLLLGLAGLALIVEEPSSHVNPVGASLVLLSAFVWAVGSVYASGTRHHPLTAPCEMLVGGTLSIIVGLSLGESAHFSLRAVSPASWAGGLWLVTASSMVGYTAYAYILRTLPAAIVSTYAYVNPVVAVVLGAALLHETLTLSTIVGGTLVTSSVAFTLIKDRRTACET